MNKLLLYIITATILISSVTALNMNYGTQLIPSGTEATYEFMNNITINGSITLNSTTITINDTYDGEEHIHTYDYEPSIATTYGIKTINISVYDEETNSLINDRNITIELIGDLESYEATSNTSNILFNTIIDQDYTIRLNAENYTETFYYYTEGDDTPQITSLNLYMLSNTSSSAITCVLYDESNNLLEGAIIKALKYYSSTNTYNVVTEGETNFEGETKLYIDKGDEYYKFMIYYPRGTLRKTTTPTYIYEDTETLTFQISLTDPVAEAFYEMLDITYSLVYNNATDNFRFTYSDADEVASNYCLKLYRLVGAKNTLINTSCSTSPAGTILLYADPINGSTYIGLALVTISGDERLLSSLSHFNPVSNDNPLWLFLAILVTIVFGLSALYSLQAFLLLTPAPLLLMSLAKLIPLSPAIIGGVYVVFIIFAFTIKK